MARASIPVFLVVCTIPAFAMAQTAPAPSPFSGSVFLANDYVYRGLSNSSGDPTLQGTFQYTSPVGAYAEIAGSNTSWITDGYGAGSSHPIEIDFFLGWKFAAPRNVNFDVGVERYAFPGHAPLDGYPPGTTNPDTSEAYVGVTWRWISLRYAYAFTDAFGNADSRGSDYLDLTIAAPLGRSGFTLTAHAGRQRFDGVNAALWPPSTSCSNRCLSYTDYLLGVDKPWHGFDFSLSFTHTNARARAFDGSPVYLNRFGDNIGANHWIISVTKSF